MALKISLKPGERFIINGAVLTNGDRRTVMIVQNKAAILRERDLMSEDDATTPARRVYFLCMLSYLDGEGGEDYYQRFSERMDEFMSAIQDQRVRLVCAQVSFAMMNREHYRAITGCRELIDYEDRVTGKSRVAGSASQGA